MPLGHVLGPVADMVSPLQIMTKRMGREGMALRFRG